MPIKTLKYLLPAIVAARQGLARCFWLVAVLATILRGVFSRGVFERNQGGVAENWGQVKELTASDSAQNNLFACDLDLNADTLVVGSSGNNSSTGAAHIFERNPGGAEAV